MRSEPSLWCCRASSDDVSSMWPCTTWPPRRPSIRTGRSRFTGSPASRCPRAVRAMVSGTASAAHHPSPWSTAVRQQPFTAIDAPIVTSSSTRCASITRRIPLPPLGSRDRMRPSSSMMPVNTLVLSDSITRERTRSAGGPRGARTRPTVATTAGDDSGRHTRKAARAEPGRVFLSHPDCDRRPWILTRSAGRVRGPAELAGSSTPDHPGRIAAGWDFHPTPEECLQL